MHAKQDQPSNHLSVIVVAHNEEDNLEACLSTLGCCDVIIVVLDRCTDRSLEIVRRYTNKVVTGAWEAPWGPRRHADLDLVKEGWILEVGADERVTDISDMMARLDRYTSVRALDLKESGDMGTLLRNVIRVFSRFYKWYVRRGGYREGHWGILIAQMAGLYPLLSYLRARLE